MLFEPPCHQLFDWPYWSLVTGANEGTSIKKVPVSNLRIYDCNLLFREHLDRFFADKDQDFLLSLGVTPKLE